MNFILIYNWTAATLGSGTITVTAQDSVCPKGWKLPGYSGASSYRNLVDTTYVVANDAYGANKARRWPLGFLPTGEYAINRSSSNGGYIDSRATDGSWWINVGARSNDSGSYVLLVGVVNLTIGVSPQREVSRGYGYAIRCVVRS